MESYRSSANNRSLFRQFGRRYSRLDFCAKRCSKFLNLSGWLSKFCQIKERLVWSDHSAINSLLRPCSFSCEHKCERRRCSSTCMEQKFNKATDMHGDILNWVRWQDLDGLEFQSYYKRPLSYLNSYAILWFIRPLVCHNLVNLPIMSNYEWRNCF